MIPLILKYPNFADEIDEYRKMGLPDQQIDARISQILNMAQFKGTPLSTINAAVGRTPDNYRQTKEYQEQQRVDLFARLNYLTPEQARVKLSEIKERKAKGEVNPLETFFTDAPIQNVHALLPIADKLDIATEKVVIPKKRSLSDTSRIDDAGDVVYFYNDDASFLNTLTYFAGRMAIKATVEPVQAASKLLYSGLEKLAPDGSWIDGKIKELQAAVSRPLEDTSQLVRFVKGYATNREIEAKAAGFIPTILNDIENSVADFAGIMTNYFAFASMTKAALSATGARTIADSISAVAKIGGASAGEQGFQAMARAAASNAAMVGTHAFLTTDGTLLERLNAGLYRSMYGISNYLVGAMGPTGAKLMLTDFLVDSLLTTPQYLSMIHENGINEDTSRAIISDLTMNALLSMYTNREPSQLKENARIYSMLSGKSYVQAMRELRTGATKMSEFMARQNTIDSMEKMIEGIRGGAPEYRLADETKKMWDIALQSVQKFAGQELQAVPWRMSLDDYMSLNKDKMPAEAMEKIRKFGSDLLSVHTTMDVIKKAGGLRVDELKAALGDTEVSLLRKAKRGLVSSKEDALTLDDAVLKAQEAGLDIKSRDDLIEKLKIKSPYDTKTLKRIASGEIEEDALKKSLHYNMVIAAMNSGEIPDAVAVKDYPDLKELYDKLVSLPTTDELLKSPEAAARRLLSRVGTATSLGTLTGKAQIPGLTEAEQALVRNRLTSVAKRMLAMSESKRTRVTARDTISATLTSLGLGKRLYKAMASPEDLAAARERALAKPEDERTPFEMELVYMKPLEQVTAGELMAAYVGVKKVYDEGVKLKKQWIRDFMAPVENAYKELRPILDGTDPEAIKERLSKVGKAAKEEVPEVLKAKSSGKKNKLLAAAHATAGITWRMDRIFDMIDGYKDGLGKFAQTFIGGADKAEAQKLYGLIRFNESIEELQLKLGIGVKDLVTKTPYRLTMPNGEQKSFTLNEMMHIYALWKNPRGKWAVANALGILDEDYALIEQNIPEPCKKFVDETMPLLNEYYERLRVYMADKFDESLQKEPNYFPIPYAAIYDTQKTAVESFLNFTKIESQRRMEQKYVSHNMTKNRKILDKNFDADLRLGYYETLLHYVTNAEHFMAYGALVRRFNALLPDKNFRPGMPALGRIIKDKYGDVVYRATTEWVRDIASPDAYKHDDLISKHLRAMKGNMARMWLAYNIGSMLKQVPSSLLAAADAGPGYFLSSARSALIDWERQKTFMEQMSPEMKLRDYEQVLDDLRKRESTGVIESVVKVLGDPGLSMLYCFDKVAVTIGWNAVFNRYRDLGWGEEAAAARATRTILNTQSASAAKDLPMLYKHSEALNMALIFTNELNNAWNIATHDLYGYFKNKQFSKLAVQTIALGLAGAVVWSIENGKAPESKEEWLQAFTAEEINSIPIAGKVLSGKMTGYRASSDPISQAVSAVYDGVETLINLDKPIDPSKVAKMLSFILGMPYSGPKRIFDFLQTMNPEDLYMSKKNNPKLPYQLDKYKNLMNQGLNPRIFKGWKDEDIDF